MEQDKTKVILPIDQDAVKLPDRLVGIVRYNSKSIVTNGKKKFYPFEPLDRTLGKSTYLVPSNKRTKLAHWAVVKPFKVTQEKTVMEMVEIFGPVHNMEIERQALLRHYNVLPRRYPKKAVLEPKPMDFLDLTGQNAFSLDDVSTQDVDDCLAVEYVSDTDYTIWVHIAMVGHQFGPQSALGKHVLEHCSSVYASDKERPLLHTSLSHGSLSLLEGEERPVVSLKISVKGSAVTKEHLFAKIRNHNKSTYDAFDSSSSREKTLLQNHTKELSGKKVVAALMVEYNQYFGQLLGGLIRTQDKGLPAKYELSRNAASKLHHSLSINCYTHATSPIRRIADIVIQWMLIYGVEHTLNQLDSGFLEHINRRSIEIKRCHRDSFLLDLVYMTKGQEVPVTVTMLEYYEDSFRAEIAFGDNTIRSWFPITNSLVGELDTVPNDGTFDALLCGYHCNGFPRIRLKWQ